MKFSYAFNGRIAKYHDSARALNTDVGAYNDAATSFGTEANAHTIKCSNRPYRDSDLAKLPENLRALVSKDSQPFDLPAVFDDEPGRGPH